MSTSASFCNLPLSTAVDAREVKSRLSLDWVLTTGIRTFHSVASGLLTVPGVETGFSVQMNLLVASSLPFDAVLGRDWIQYCRECVPNGRLIFSSGIIDLRHHPFIHPAVVPGMTLTSRAAEQPPLVDHGVEGLILSREAVNLYTVHRSSFNVQHVVQSSNECNDEIMTPVQRNSPPHVHPPVQSVQPFIGNSDLGLLSTLSSDPFVQLSLEEKKIVVDFICYCVEDHGRSTSNHVSEDL
ncbi:hypothetical protein K438DRAFT_1764723 [Mycena galopus ATCC 62051]|nr:hypothetical protein K438DRAFT_1764723 [Mycena galopus ATCC 62051]